MHYRNGREVKPGDRALNLVTGIAGLVYNISASSVTCNAQLAEIKTTDSYVTLSDCVHIDDVRDALSEVKDAVRDQKTG